MKKVRHGQPYLYFREAGPMTEQSDLWINTSIYEVFKAKGSN